MLLLVLLVITCGSQDGYYEDGCLLGYSAVNSYQSTQRYRPEDSHLHGTTCILIPDRIFGTEYIIL
jgi:hypothetical protein